jgi:tripartite-type tricarboxylate transporter receptor subunit TctC
LSTASAQTSIPAGQPISLIISSGTGGGYDLYGRLVARHLGRHLPNNPAIVPRNMPGAGSIQAANYMYNSAPKDGTAIAIFQNGTAFEPLLGVTQAKYDGKKFNWLGSLNRLVNIALVWHQTPFYSAADLFTKQIIVGGNPGNTTTMPNLLNGVLGTKFKVIPGYQGSNDITLAMERGELDGLVGTSWDSFKATKSDWVRDKKARILLQVSFGKHAELPDVPDLEGFVKNDDDRKLLEVILARQEYGRPFAAPPDVPAAIVGQLRKAFEAMAADKEFLSDAERINAEIVVNTGDQIAALVDRIYNSPRPVIDRAIVELKRAGG